MSRLIVKGLPKYYTDSNVRELFAFAGELTDAKVVLTRDGRSRQFGFVGFRTRQEAAVALKALDRTYVGTAKVSVEFARAVGDGQLPRPWSKYSEGSSRFKSANDVAEKSVQNPKRINKKRESQEENRSSEKKNGAQRTKLRIDERREDFCEATEKRNAVPIWADGRIHGLEEHSYVHSRKKGSEGKMLSRKHVTFQDSDTDDDASYQDFPTSAVDAERDSESREEKGGETALDEEVSDSAYFKSKVVSNISQEASEGEPVNAAPGETDSHGTETNDLGSNSQPDGKPFAGLDAENTDESRGNHIAEGGVAESRPQTETEKASKSYRPDGKKYLSDGVDAADTGRLLIRNLAFSTTEAELESEFEAFGTLADVHIVKDRKTGHSKGMAFVHYMIPENAATAMAQTDGSFLSGRILHVLPAKPRPATGYEKPGLRGVTQPGSSSFKIQKDAAQKEAALRGDDDVAQHALHMSSDAIAEVASRRHGVSKSDLLGVDEGESGVAAVRLAMAEASIQQETRQYLITQGIDLGAASIASAEMEANTGSARRKRVSRVAFLVKNLPSDTTEKDLHAVFGKVGSVKRLLVVPSGLLAVVEYTTASDAKRAYNKLAYTKFRDTPLYLEWLPTAALQRQLPEQEQPVSTDQKQNDSASNPQGEHPLPGSQLNGAGNGSRTVFVKNLNFDTRDKELKDHFVQALRKRGRLAASLRSAKVALKRAREGKESETLSMGFGFLEFATPNDAVEAVKMAQNTTLAGHALHLSISDPGGSKSVKKTKRPRTSPARKPCPKLIVRNVAFEATRNDIRRLFSAFGQLKVVRLPKKMDGSHRGFAFVEFVSKGEAQSAFEALSSTHLFGRHLVIEYAEEGEDRFETISALQDKTAAYISRKRIRQSEGTQFSSVDETANEDHDMVPDEELQDALYA